MTYLKKHGDKKMKTKIYQSWNPRNQSWIKYKLEDRGKYKKFIPLDVKQRNPNKPFKGIKKYRRKK